MGTQVTSYAFYGVQIDVNPYDEDGSSRPVDRLCNDDRSASEADPGHIRRYPDLGHLQAGNYDRDRFFLVTACFEAGWEANPISYDPAKEASWRRQLEAAVIQLKWKDVVLGTVGWYVIADES